MLAGLVFIGVSVNLDRVLAVPGVSGRASEPLIVLLVLLVVSCPCALVISTPVTIVSGAAGSGKSTYLRQHVGPNDVVIDLDAIQRRMDGAMAARLPAMALMCSSGRCWIGRSS